ncbi:MAG: hypothetical protein GY859_04995 [Desulfobacterales bacterium]|nr:hypothetical protein [Desulfobacterales bacterium]
MKTVVAVISFLIIWVFSSGWSLASPEYGMGGAGAGREDGGKGSREGSWDAREAREAREASSKGGANGVALNGIQLNGVEFNGVVLQGKGEGGGVQAPGDGKAGGGRPRPVRVSKTRFIVQKDDGSIATPTELIGALLVATGEHGVTEAFRIDEIEKFSSPETGEIFFYTFSVENEKTGKWVNFCHPDRKGGQKGFPLAGYWDEMGGHVRSEDEYSLTCTSGTIGKCVLMGYLPWKSAGGGESLWEYHQACVRMLRADYCGNGKHHTREGTRVELFDRLDVQVDTSEPGLTFEAGWNEHGAVCMRKTRIPQDYTLDDILRECPEKLKGAVGEGICLESFDDPRVKILNRSPDPR